MEPTLVEQGLGLMLYGMGTVFVFLALLVAATQAMSALVQRMPRSQPAVSLRRPEKIASADDQRLIAVIGAAIHQHQHRSHRGQHD